MKRLSLAALLLLPLPISAEESVYERWTEDRTLVFEGSEINLEELEWPARPIVVFAQSPNDVQFQRQMELLLERVEELAERDVIIITDTDPEAFSDLRRKLRPRGFMLTLLGKDGQVKLRKPAPWDVRELSRSIDKMPMRQQEIRDRRVVEE